MLPLEQAEQDLTEPFRPGGVLLFGYLRKLKRMKKKWFCLFGESEQVPARLEYFDSEKKWKNGQAPKRSIIIKACFNINRRTDCKQHKFVIALYTNEDCFPIVFETEEELLRWFITLLKIQLADQVAEGEELKPRYEHVWQVTIRNKELGSRKNMVGPHRLCLTSRILTLFRMPLSDPPEFWEFPVMTIRRCGHYNSQFFMEMGRGTVTGAGELWMDLEEASVAQSMHGAIIDAMRNSAKEDLGPRPRTRSSSANEQNRPALHGAWNPSTSSAATPPTGMAPTTSSSLRNRADSVPSRSRTSSEMMVTPPDGYHQLHGASASPSPSIMASPNNLQQCEPLTTSFSMDDFDMQQPSAVPNVYLRSRFSRTATPENSLPNDATILEEGSEPDYLLMNCGNDGHQLNVHQPSTGQDYLSMTPQASYSSSPSTQSAAGTAAAAMRSGSIGMSSSRVGGEKPKTSTDPPPIKPPLHQNPYMQMSSPSTTAPSSWSSPSNALPDGYMPMYPHSSGPGSVGTRSGTHTRSSSFCEDVTDGSYVHMAPQSVASNSSTTSRDEDVGSSYMDMQSGSSAARRSVPRDVQLPLQHNRGRMSPASCSSLASSLSMTSGTPPVGSASRFAEFHLEKVASLLTPSEDDGDSVSSLKCRQSRAYSVGSRPDLRPDLRLRKLAKLEHPSPLAAPCPPPASPFPPSVVAQHQAGLVDARVRAYSVGSRGVIAAGSGASAGGPLTTSSCNSSSSVNSSRTDLDQSALQSPAYMMMSSQQQDDIHRKKSLSVPVLGSPNGPHGGNGGVASNSSYAPNNRTGTFLRTVLAHQSAARRDNDLMEIEFCNMNGLGGGVDVTDGAPSSYAATYGSTDSVGHASVASTSSGGGGNGGIRPRSASNSRPTRGTVSRNVGVKAKESFRGRPGKLERLESVPQGRDQDYIYYGLEQDKQPDFHTSLGSPEISSPRILGDQDSADEYVELVTPAGGGRLASHREGVSRLPLPGNADSAGSHSGLPSPLPGDHLTTDYGKTNSVAASLNTVLCQIAKEPGDSGPPSAYMEMNCNSSKSSQPPSQPASVSDNEGYLPMDYTPKSSRNPSRQSSQADLVLALGAFSPSTHQRGSQTPRSESARHSRTEESLLLLHQPEEQHYMEMTFNESTQSLRSDKSSSTRMRGPSPYLPEAPSSGALTDSESGATGTATPTKSGSRATAFLSNLLGRKSSSSSSSKSGHPSETGSPMGVTESGTLPRSSRSMPPSPFSSLKRTKSSGSKKRRTATAAVPPGAVAQSVSPVSPDVDPPTLFYHQRSQSLKLPSPMTPPSPTTDFVSSRLLPQPSSQLSPPNATTCKPGSSQPINIAFQRAGTSSASGYTPRGSPVTGLNLNLRVYDHPDGSTGHVLPHRTSFSSSPGRLVTMMPTLSPLPEVLHINNPAASAGANNLRQVDRNASVQSNRPRASGPSASDSGYMNMAFGASSSPLSKLNEEKMPASTVSAPGVQLAGTAEPSQPVCIPVKGVPPAVDAIEDKENNAAAILISSKSNETISPTATLMSGSTAVSDAVSASSTGTCVAASAVSATSTTTPAKQRANSLEKIVCAFEKVKIGPKRHSSGDKPPKRSGSTLIFRSNSYQPSSGSRVVVSGNKPVSLTPFLTDIPAGKVVTSSSSEEVGGVSAAARNAKSPTGLMGPPRTSSSSLASLGEDTVAGELLAVHWQPVECSRASPLTAQLSSGSPAPVTGGTSSPSPSVTSTSTTASRPVSALGEREINYAQLDLTSAIRPSDAEEVDVPRSPRNPPPRPASLTTLAEVTGNRNGGTAYAQIDFNQTAHS